MKKLFLQDQPLNQNMISLISLFLRLWVAGAMLTHGIAKINAFEMFSATFPDPLGFGNMTSLILAIGAEFGCSIMLILGLLTRLSLLPLMFTMIVAGFVVNAGAPFAVRELAIMYLVIYIVIFALGPGKYSLDNLIFKK